MCFLSSHPDDCLLSSQTDSLMSAAATLAQGRVKGQSYEMTSAPHAGKLTNNQCVGACSDAILYLFIYLFICTANNFFFSWWNKLVNEFSVRFARVQSDGYSSHSVPWLDKKPSVLLLNSVTVCTSWRVFSSPLQMEKPLCFPWGLGRLVVRRCLARSLVSLRRVVAHGLCHRR